MTERHDAALTSEPWANDPIVVTTADDVVDVGDGELSLREAVTLANDRSGSDTVTFAEELGEGPIVLENDEIVVSDDLVIDGDTADGGFGSITIIGGPFIVSGTSARFEDLTIDGDRPDGVYLGNAVLGTDAELALARVRITGLYEGGVSTAVGLSGGTLDIQDSRFDGPTDDLGSFGVRAVGDVTVARSTFADVGGAYGGGAFDVVGTLAIEGSLIEGGTAIFGGSAIAVDGSLELVNSTITRTDMTPFGGYEGEVIRLASDSDGLILNSTIAGNTVGDEPGAALFRVDVSSVLRLENSLVLDNDAADGAPLAVDGTLTSNGGNVFAQDVVEGAAVGDVLGAVAADVFTTGDLADNGGPTRTVALLDDPANPAIGQADPADAPADDQRGFARDAAPDAGAFEAGAGPVLPPSGDLPAVIAGLEEKVAVDPALVNGVPEEALAGDGGAFEVTFLGGVGAQDNALGYYVVGANGVIGETGFLFADTQGTAAGTTTATPEVEAGESLGLFLLADGAGLNDPADLGGDGFVFENRNGKAADVDFVRQPGLFFSDGAGVEGRVLHASDYVEGDAGNRLNPQGGVRALSATGDDGALYVAFEDKPFNPDGDFNDVVLKIERPGETPPGMGADDLMMG